MSDLFSCIGAVFRGAWDALTGINFPGTGISFAAIMVGTFCACTGLALVGTVAGLTFKGMHYRSGDNFKGKISAERRGDVK